MTARRLIWTTVMAMLCVACGRMAGGRVATQEERDEIQLLNDSGSSMRNLSDFASALRLHEQALELAQKAGDSVGWVIATNHLGTDMRRLGELQEALTYHLEALRMAEEIAERDTSHVARKNVLRSLNGLGNVQMTAGQLDDAEESFRKALAGEKSLESDLGQAINYANIGSVKRDQGQLDSAMYYFRLSMESNRKARSATGIGLCHTYFGEVAVLQGDMDKAVKEFMAAYDTLVHVGDDWHTLNPMFSATELLLQRGNLTLAREIMHDALRMAEGTQSLEHKLKANQLMADLEDADHHPLEALRYMKRSKILSDSLLSSEKLMEMQKTRVNYERKKNAQHMAVLEGELEMEHLYKTVYLTGGIIALLLAVSIILLTLSYRRVQRQKRQVIEDNLRMMEKNAQAQRELYARISHEFRTPLTVVNGLTEQLSTDAQLSDEEQRSLSGIRKQSDMMLLLVNQLLETAHQMDGTIVVPWKQTAPDTPTPEEDNPPLAMEDAAPDGKRTVLVAEDNKDIQAVLHALLSADYHVLLASDGEEAVELLRSTMPDLIVTDVTMPRMNGFQLLEYVRKHEDISHLPVIMLTAMVGDEDRLRGLQLGADAYLQKPFNGRELMAFIDNLIQQRQQLMKKFAQALIQEGTTDEEELKTNLSDHDIQFLNECHSQASALLARQSLTTEHLCQQMCMSYSQLNRRLKGSTEMTVNGYIEKIKMAKACRMLRTTHQSIGDIALECGFQDMSYFSRIFRKAMNMTPSQYRNIEEVKSSQS